MIEFRADLHCHSTCSDGTLTPEQLVDAAKKSGLSALSITDHDTVDAYKEVLDYAKAKDLEMIPGVEFSCVYKNKSIHVLGYSFSVSNERILAFCTKHKERRINRCRSILKKLADANMPLEQMETQAIAHGTLGRPHIALAMLQKGYVQTIEEAFRNYIGEYKPCYVKGDAFPIEETIDIIHNAGGFAIIAHPHLIREKNIVRKLLEMNFDGLEAYYSRFHKDSVNNWINEAKKRNWLITGGSDFHGAVKPLIQLGCSWVGKESFEILKQRYESL